MNRTPIAAIAVAFAMLIPFCLSAQKSSIKGDDDDGGGKSSIKSEAPSGGKEEVRESSSSFSGGGSSSHESSSSSSSSSYESPSSSSSWESSSSSGSSSSSSPTYESTPSSSSSSSSSSSWQYDASNESRPKATMTTTPGRQSGSGTSSMSNQSESFILGDGRTYVPVERVTSLHSGGYIPMPLPLDPAEGPRSLEVQPGTVIHIDSVHPGTFGGTVTGPDPRPNFNGPLDARPKPHPSQPSPGGPHIGSAAPVSAEAEEPIDRPDPVISNPNTTNSPDPRNETGGGGIVGASEEEPAVFSFIPTGWGGSALDSRLACIFEASDALVGLYREPQWCVANFEQDYDFWLKSYLSCYNDLPDYLVEPWMWPCLLTFMEERNFWIEECGASNSELMYIRDYLRDKATFVPLIMVKVNSQSEEDWLYVDSAFAAPYGGKNYYDLVQQFHTIDVLSKTNRWARDYPTIRAWPSYKRVESLFSQYPKSGISSLLRAKLKLDFAQTVTKDMGVEAVENVGWLLMAVREFNGPDKELDRLRIKVRDYLRQNLPEWESHPLKSLL